MYCDIYVQTYGNKILCYHQDQLVKPKTFFALEIIQWKYDEYVCRIQIFMYQASFKETCRDGLFVQESVF